MREPVLVIMAAGMGSRFGGLKQIAPVDDQNQIIIDFSLYDAWKAGFRKVVFIIKKEIEADFREVIGDRMEKYFEVKYVFQEVDKVPEGYTVPEGRTKPWGTGHAIACARDAVDGPFAVLNADDYTALPPCRPSSTSSRKSAPPTSTPWWATTSSTPSPRAATSPAACAR